MELRFPKGGGSVDLPLPKRSWAGRAALKFDIFAAQPVKRVDVVVKDSEGASYREWYHEEFGLRKGWTGVQMPLSEIRRNLDLEKVTSLEIRVLDSGKPVVVGIDGVRLGDLEDGYDTRLAPREFLPEKDIPFRMDVETPHVKWGNPLRGGAIRGFFVPGIRHGRDMVELKQRLELDDTTVSIDRAWDINCWGIGDHYGHIRGDRNDFRLVYRYMERELQGTKPFDVMVIPCLNGWNRFPKAMRDAVRRRVRQGAGLVLIHPFTGDIHPESQDLWDLSPLVGVANDVVTSRGYAELNQEAIATGNWQVTGRHYITDGVPMAALPTQHIPFYKYDHVNGDALIEADGHPILGVRRYGKGRVAAFGYVEAGFTPMDVPPSRTNTWDDFYPDTPPNARPRPSQVTWPYWEYYYSLLCRSIVWAASREPQVRISAMNAEAARVSLTVEASRKTQVTVDLNLTDKFGKRVVSQSRRRTLKAGENSLRIDLPASEWAGGLSLVDAVMRVGDSRLDWSSDVFWTPQQVTVRNVKIDKEVYDVGAKLKGVVRTNGKPVLGMRLRISVVDDRKREVARQEVALKKGKTPFSFQLTAFLGRYGRIDVSVLEGPGKGRTVDRYLSDEFVVVPVKRNLPQYRALVSHGTGHKHYFRDAVERQVRQNGSDFGAWGSKHNNNCGVWGVGIYYYDREDYLEQKKNWQATKNRRYLWREPCLSDPKHLSALKTAIRREVRKRLPFRFDDYFLADESSITCYADAFDLCFAPHTLTLFRKWLRREYDSLQSLNETWGTAHASWDRVVPLTTDEAKTSGRLAPWMDHRTFMNTVFVELFRTIRETIRSVDPEGRTALSGTQVSVAHNGCDWWQLAPYIDRMICYQGGDQWELHRSFNPDAVVGFWTGYGSSGLAVQNAIWKALFHNISAPNIFWMYSFLNADLTYSKSGRDMGAVFRELRQGGIGRLMMEGERQHDGIAIHYSYPSIFATTAADDFQRYADNRTAWTQLIEDLGMQYNFVAYGEIEAGRLRKGDYKVLVLPYTKALSEKERKEIQSFVARGGRVLADSMTGLMDSHGTEQTQGMLDRVFGIQRGADAQVNGRLRWTGNVLIAPDSLRGVRVEEGGLEATGRAQVASQGTKAVILNEYRSGRACYLNFLVHEYSRLRNGDGAAAHPIRDVVGKVFAWLGVVPDVRVEDVQGNLVRHLEMVSYHIGGRRILCLRKENVAAKMMMGHDGVATYADDDLGQVVSESIRIVLPKAAYAVNVRTGKSYGRVRALDESLRVGDSMVIGVSPKKPGAVKVTGARTVRTGATYRYRIQIAADGMGERVVRVNVYDTGGDYVDLYSKDVLVEGHRYTGEISVAFNDRKGLWRIEAVEVGGQARDETTFEVK